MQGGARVPKIHMIFPKQSHAMTDKTSKMLCFSRNKFGAHGGHRSKEKSTLLFSLRSFPFPLSSYSVLSLFFLRGTPWFSFFSLLLALFRKFV
jgi:hypothetical protein